MAIPPVVVEFLAKGIPDVQRALKGIQQSFEQTERLQTRSAETGARARLRAASSEARQKEKDFQKTAREAERWQRQMVRTAEQASKKEAKATEQAERDKTRSVERWTKTRESIQTRSAILAGQAAVRAARDEARERERIDRESFRRREQFAKGIGAAAGRATRTVTGGIQRLGGTLMQVGGGFSIADAVKEQGQLERSAVQFSNSAYQGKGQRMDSKRLIAQAKAASIATGTDAGDLMKAAHAFGAKTGNYEEGLASMNFFGEVAKGTDASLEDVAKTAGILRVQNSDLKPEQMKSMLLATIRQGQKGSIEFGDLASSAGKITRTSSSYAGDQATNQGKLLGLAQVAMRTAGSPEEAATVLSNISADAMKHHDDVSAKLGKGAFNARGQIAKAPEEFIADVMEKTGGNLQKIQGMGFGARSMKMFQALAPTYNKAIDAKQNGRAAVLKDINDVSAGSMPYAELQQNVRNILKTDTEQFEAAVRELKMAVGTELVPAFRDMVPLVKELIPHLRKFLEGVVKIAGWAESNPLAGLGVAITALITKEIASAAIADTIKKLISGGGGAAVPGGGGGGGTGGLVALGIASGMAGQAVATAGLISDTGGAMLGGSMKGEDLAAMANSSDPAKRAEAQAAMAKARKKGSTLDVAAGYVDRAVTIGGAVFNPVAAMGSYFGDQAVDAAGIKSRSTRSNEAIEASQTVSKFDELTKGAGEATQALKSLATAAGASAGGQSSTSVENRTKTIAARTGK